MADMDEGSKGGQRSVLIFGIAAAIMIVLMIGIGVSGRSAGTNTANTESPATSQSQNP
jgi:hypothetical protein